MKLLKKLKAYFRTELSVRIDLQRLILDTPSFLLCRKSNRKEGREFHNIAHFSVRFVKEDVEDEGFVKALEIEYFVDGYQYRFIQVVPKKLEWSPDLDDKIVTLMDRLLSGYSLADFTRATKKTFKIDFISACNSLNVGVRYDD